MTIARLKCGRTEDPMDVLSKMGAMNDAVESLRQTFAIQFGLQLELALLSR